jgi:hypothetical protein
LTNERVTAFGFSDSCIFAATDNSPWINSGVYRTTDDGKSWVCANTFPAARPITDLGWCRSSDGSKKYLFAATSGGVFRSTDDGLSWAVTNNGLSETYLSAFAVGGGYLFAGTYGVGGIFCSSDYGENWRTVNTGLPTPYPFIRAFAVITDSVGATTILAPIKGDAGIWRASLADLATSVRDEASELPSHFTLLQNYPNPFNPSTTIKYELSKSSEVRLTVFDMLGREVSVLVNERRNAGVHQVKFDGSGLSSGVYVYRIQAGDFFQSKKLLLLR